MNIVVKNGFYIGDALFTVEESMNVSAQFYQNLKMALYLQSVAIPYTRVGDAYDGGYLMADNFEGNIAYSFGINDDVSWDTQMAEKGYNVYMYDPTIEDIPTHRDEFHFFKEGLMGEADPEKSMDTLESFIRRNGHTDKKNMILKIDIEGCEWSFLSTVTPEILNQFDQILFEFHDITKGKSLQEQGLILESLNKLNRTHQLVHLHANNCSRAFYINGQCIPDTLEATYVKADKYELLDDDPILSRELDAPNDRVREELALGNWNVPLCVPL